MNVSFKTVAMGALLSFGSMVQAAPIQIDLSAVTSSVTVSSSPLCLPVSVCGATGSLAADLDSQVQELDIGDSWTFDFFTLEFFGFGFGTALIDAQLGFDLPVGLPDVTSLGVAGYFASFGEATGLVLSWNPIAPVLLDDGSSLQVEFENLSDVEVAGELTVHATITRLGPAAEVNEPATLGLLGLGAILLGQLRRRRN